jgi:hypothetical protein
LKQKLSKVEHGFKGMTKLRELQVDIASLLGLYIGIDPIAPPSKHAVLIRGKGAPVRLFKGKTRLMVWSLGAALNGELISTNRMGLKAFSTANQYLGHSQQDPRRTLACMNVVLFRPTVG